MVITTLITTFRNGQGSQRYLLGLGRVCLHTVIPQGATSILDTVNDIPNGQQWQWRRRWLDVAWLKQYDYLLLDGT